MKTLALLAAAAALGLAGCGTAGKPMPDPTIQTKAVNMTVAVRCDPDVGPAPDYPDTDAALKTPDDLQWGKLMIAGRILRIAREAQLSAALAACASAPK
jgi:hypothetical protein